MKFRLIAALAVASLAAFAIDACALIATADNPVIKADLIALDDATAKASADTQAAYKDIAAKAPAAVVVAALALVDTDAKTVLAARAKLAADYKSINTISGTPPT